MKNERFYNFMVQIYRDDPKFPEQINSLITEDETIYIEHDKDIYDNGELKKAHYHFILKLKNACTISALSKRVGVAENMIEPIKKSFNGALKYLIHYKNDNKYQYDIEEVKSNSDKLLRKFQDLVKEDTPEIDKVIAIQDFIENTKGIITMGQLGRYVQSINKWDAFRRNMVYFIRLIDEHNSKIYESNIS